MRHSKAIIYARSWLIAASLILYFPVFAHAGMPSFGLTDIAKMRLETISFFLLIFFLSAGAVQGIWNLLRRDFVRLPKLTYWRSLAFVGLWGFLFILVLTMISGARELMTPGAWVKNGATYKLNAPPATQTSKEIWEQTVAQRKSRLEELRSALWNYANEHGGAFPADDRVAGISERIWETPDVSRARYFYVKGQRADTGDLPLAYEPRIFPGARLVLYTDGQIREASENVLQWQIEHLATQPTARSAR